MIRSPRWWAVAIRRPDDTIHAESHAVDSILERSRGLDRPGLRGVFALAETMRIGVRALSISARHSSSSSAGRTPEVSPREMALAIGSALVLFIGLFIVVPGVVVAGGVGAGGLVGLSWNVAEGLVRLAILAGYVLAVSRMPDIRRVFEYHGAEHMVIAAHEAGEPPTVEAARRFSTIHVRCGTNFLVLLMLVAIVVFTIPGRPALGARILWRLALAPVVAAAAYELLRAAARRPDSPAVKLLTWPGLMMQRITTRQPNDAQVEVALAALRELQQRDPSADPPEGPGEPDAA